MKGQYLAVESILTFGLGLVLAIGVIGVVDIYSSNIYDTSEEVQASIIHNQVLEAFNVLNAVEGEAVLDVELPESAGKSDYYVEVGDTINVIADGERYEKNLLVDGSVSGSGSGSVQIVKSEEGYSLNDR